MSHRLNERFYDGKDKYDAEATINRHVGGRITKDDARLIRAYIAEKQATDHIGPARSRKIAVHLVGIRRFIRVPYGEMTTEDVIEGFSALKVGHSVRFKRNGEVYEGGPFKPNTLCDYVKITKGFIGWLNNTQRTKDAEISERRLKNTQRIEGAGITPYKPEDLLTASEIDAMILGAQTIRDKALISVMFESAARVGEIARLTWGDLKFLDEYVECTIYDTKAKKNRYPTLVDSRGILISHRNNYRGKAEGDNFVFLSENGEPLSYIGCVRMLQRAARKAAETVPGIMEKPFWRTHVLRHSSGTKMINDGMNEADVKEIMWGNINSDQIKTYVNRSQGQIRDAVLRRRGLKPEEAVEKSNQPQRCRWCHDLNPVGKKYCGKCGRPLSKGEEANQQTAMTDIIESLKDPGIAAQAQK